MRRRRPSSAVGLRNTGPRSAVARVTATVLRRRIVRRTARRRAARIGVEGVLSGRRMRRGRRRVSGSRHTPICGQRRQCQHAAGRLGCTPCLAARTLSEAIPRLEPERQSDMDVQPPRSSSTGYDIVLPGPGYRLRDCCMRTGWAPAGAAGGSGGRSQLRRGAVRTADRPTGSSSLVPAA